MRPSHAHRIVALGISAGPTLGGWITETATWRWIFYVNVPIGIAGIAATLAILPADRKASRTPFDIAGAVLLGIALAALTTLLSLGTSAGWTSPVALALAAVALVAGALFVWQELRHAHPLLDHRLFENRLFTWATISLVLSFLAVYATAFLLPIYLEQLRGFDVLKTGLLLTPFPLVVAVIAPISGHVADRIGTRWLAAAGMTLLCAGMLLLARLDAHTSLWGVVWPQTVAAFGQALFQSPNNSAISSVMPSPSIASTCTGTTRRENTLPSLVIVTSADGAPRVSTVADTLPRSSGTISASVGHGSASSAMPTPGTRPMNHCAMRSVRDPFMASAIARGSPAWRRSSALDSATVRAPFVTSVHGPTSSSREPTTTSGATARSSPAASRVSRPIARRLARHSCRAQPRRAPCAGAQPSGHAGCRVPSTS